MKARINYRSLALFVIAAAFLIPYVAHTQTDGYVTAWYAGSLLWPQHPARMRIS